MTIEDIKQVIHRFDLMKRPYILFLHPDDAKAIKTSMPTIEEEVVLNPTQYVEKGKVICIKRKDLESWVPPNFND